MLCRQFFLECILYSSQEEEHPSEIRDEIKALTEEALQPDADYPCMEKLKEILEDAKNFELDENELLASHEVLEQLEVRISKVKL